MKRYKAYALAMFISKGKYDPGRLGHRFNSRLAINQVERILIGFTLKRIIMSEIKNLKVIFKGRSGC